MSSPHPTNTRTEILYGAESTLQRGVRFMQNSKEKMDLFGDKNGPSIIMEYDAYRNNYIDLINRGGKIRLITEITRDNLQYCKALMKIVSELRHLDGLIGGIAVTESEFMSTSTLKKKELLPVVFYSNEEEIVRSGQYIFDTFWEKAIPARRRIKEIEQSLNREYINTVQDPVEIRRLIINLISSAIEEIQLLLPSWNVFQIYLDEGIINLLKAKAETEKKNMMISILIKEDGGRGLEHGSPASLFSNLPNVQILSSRSIKSKLATMIVDKERSLLVEMKGDLDYDFMEATGLATYSNSEATVISNYSIFEMLWVQAEIQHQSL